jgi:hypothetical protein
MKAKPDQSDDTYDEPEAERRFESTLRAALATPPTPTIRPAGEYAEAEAAKGEGR